MERATRFILATFICVFVSSRSIAGIWTGGGEFLESASNPWFLQNTMRATYCIDVDAEHFAVARGDLATIVSGALDFWKDEFVAARLPASSAHLEPKIAVATQFFVQVACDDDVDIRFQFGTLTPAQLRDLSAQGIDPSRFAGFSQLESYDPATMHGKGFVYIAADSGPLRFQGTETVASPWTYQSGRLLFGVLLHELGHVFGLPHAGGVKDVMGAGFPEYFISKERAEVDRETHRVFAGVLHFRGASGKVACKIPQLPVAARTFFSLPDNAQCLSFDFHAPGRISVRWSATLSDFAEAGSITLAADEVVRLSELVRIWLPQGQRVFTNLPPGSSNILAGPARVHQDRHGVFLPRDGSPGKVVLMQMEPSVFQIGGFIGENVILDLLQGTD